MTPSPWRRRCAGSPSDRTGTAGAERVRRQFTWSRVAAETEAVYQQLVPTSVDVREAVLSRGRTTTEEA